jgi:hypothetical protein
MLAENLETEVKIDSKTADISQINQQLTSVKQKIEL